jgi:hypothetical protein
VQNENALTEFERDKMNPKLTQTIGHNIWQPFEEFPHALSSPLSLE